MSEQRTIREVVERLATDCRRYHPEEMPPIYQDILVLLRHLDSISPVWHRFRDDDSDTWAVHEDWPFLFGAVSDLLVWNACDGVHLWSKGSQTPPGTHFALPPAAPDAISDAAQVGTSACASDPSNAPGDA